MAASKSKYQVSVTKLHRLPPIREESMSGRTPRSGRRANRDSYLTSDGKITVQQLHSKPTIHVRPLAGNSGRKVQFEPRKSMSTKSETDILDSYPKTVYSDKPKESITNINPHINPQRTLVDGLVADYLHYAQYGHIIPVYEGTDTLSCSCCTDRNRENVRTMLGFPTNPTHQTPYNSVGPKPIGPNPKPDTWLTGHVSPAKNIRSPNPSPRFDNINTEPWSDSTPREKWLDYQPKPYASSYTNAEFNRPSVVYNHFRESNENAHSKHKYVSHDILDANTKYDDAMKKLEKFSFS